MLGHYFTVLHFLSPIELAPLGLMTWVSLMSILCIVMETLVKKKILEHLIENDLICKEQHGLTPGRSCCTQLLDTLDFWTQTLEDGSNIDAVYTDFKKAFDSVPHRTAYIQTQKTLSHHTTWNFKRFKME